MIAVTAELRAKPGCQQDLERLMGSMAQRATTDEPGCRVFRLARSRHDPQLYLSFQRYDDDAAMSAHSHAEYFTSAIPAMMECLEELPRLAVFDELGD